MSVQPRLQPGDVLGGRYRILAMLGQGGMGTVFLAEDGRLPGKLWAVKEIRPHARSNSLLMDEARFLAECSHPGLAAIADFFPSGKDGAAYLVMEYIEGQTLERSLSKGHPFPWVKAVRIAIELCEVLAYLHEGRPKPIIYRDLKPSNIMLDKRGRVRLIDFGTARHYNLAAESDTVHLGTIGFAAPEQLAGKQTDARTDIYTLGALLYYLLSGGEFYTPETSRLRHLPTDIPASLSRVIGSMLDPKPDKRIQRAEEVKRNLQEILYQREEALSSELEQFVEPLKEEGPPERLILVVGGLTGGSGASFAAAALARVLHRHRIQHAVVELPGVKPDLYQMLFGEKNSPKEYVYRAEAVLHGGGSAPSRVIQWTDGYTEWLPLPPDRPVEGWTAEHTKRLLRSLASPVIIFDIGENWLTEPAEALCRKAFLNLLVCGPSPVHLSRATSSGIWMRLRQLEEDGVRVQVIANRSADFSGREEWLRSLPAEPLCHIPELPFRDVISCSWKGRLVADQPSFQSVLTEALEPAVSKIRNALEAPSAHPSVWSPIRESPWNQTFLLKKGLQNLEPMLYSY